MLKFDGKNLMIGVMCFLLVFMITLQIRTINVSESDILRLKTENELRDEINQWKDVYANATEKINELNSKISDYQKSASMENDAVALIKKELDSANILAGLVAVKGEGIIITLDDTEALNDIAIQAGYYDPSAYIIHDSDLLMVINELRSAGAEAISINGQRITSSTEVRCVGPQVTINGVRVVAPFEILAIGESTKLQGSLNLRGGIIDSLKASSIDVTIEKKEEIVISAFEKPITYQYAKSLDDGKE